MKDETTCLSAEWDNIIIYNSMNNNGLICATKIRETRSISWETNTAEKDGH